MRTNHRTALAAVACTGLLFTAACADNGDDPEPEPTTTSTSSSSPTPTTTQPAWESKYTAKELKAYETALARFTEYEQRAEPIWARGKVTPGAEALLKEYWATWPNTLNTLRFYEANDVQIHGTPGVLESRASRVQLINGGGHVVIRQCVDFGPTTTIQRGKNMPRAFTGPRVRMVNVDYVGAPKQWLITSAEANKERRC